MIGVGIDEFTAVLQLPPDEKAAISAFEWRREAERLIHIFVKKAGLVPVFGQPALESKAPQGYTMAYKFGQHMFYFSIAYHETQKSMGVVIRFSAQSLAYYCEATGQKVYEFLQMVIDPAYVLRLSRVDIAVDYIDENLDVTDIYQSLIDKKVGIFREMVSPKTGEIFYRRCDMQISGFIKGDEVPTIYLGSVQSNAQLRIYDKKREQLERKGSKYVEARRYKSWVRFEGVYRSVFAHQLTNALASVQNDDELLNLLAYTILQKFRFMYMNCGVAEYETEYTQVLFDCIGSSNFILSSPSSRNYDLAKSICYMLHGSGVISTLYKIAQIWGNDGLTGIANLLNQYLTNWVPNDDCRYWLNRNLSDYQIYYPDFDSFFNENVLPLLWQIGE